VNLRADGLKAQVGGEVAVKWFRACYVACETCGAWNWCSRRFSLGFGYFGHVDGSGGDLDLAQYAAGMLCAESSYISRMFGRKANADGSWPILHCRQLYYWLLRAARLARGGLCVSKTTTGSSASLARRIVDETDSYLSDIERAVWVVGDDDEEMPPLYFGTAEAALLAYDRSQRAAELRAKRREEALRRLGKVAGR